MSIKVGSGIIKESLLFNLNPADTVNYILDTVEVLVVAGGGGGGTNGSGNDVSGGGGGAGGLKYISFYPVTPGTPITVTVGNGGATSQNAIPGNGQNSVFGNITALGGGRGAGYAGGAYYAASSGGSGGGGAYSNNSGASGTPGQGFSGGDGTNSLSPGCYASGGGGGSGGPGQTQNGKGKGGDGGPGLLYNISGVPRYYAAGGGGGAGAQNQSNRDYGRGGIGGGGAGSDVRTYTNGIAGEPNTGSGGGGGGNVASSPYSNTFGGAGGSGVVIVRYPGPQKATGGTITNVEGYTIHTFTSSGTFTPLSAPVNGGTVYGLLNLNSTNLVSIATNGTVTYNSSNGGALVFDGTGPYLTTSDTKGHLNLSSQFTASIWVYYVSGNGRIFQKDGPSVTRCWEMGGYGGNFRIELWHSDGSTTGGVSADALTVNGWMQIVMTFDGTNILQYQNGTLRKTTSFPGDMRTDINTPILVGGYFPGEAWNGRIGSAQIYSRALTSTEILRNYNVTKGVYGL